MLDFDKSDNMRCFEKFITSIEGKEAVPMSISVYHCCKLFQLKYGDVPNWKKSLNHQTEWLSELASLKDEFLAKEENHELPFGTATGIHMTMVFYKAVAMNESAQTINTMFDYIEKFNKIGYQISQDSSKNDSEHRNYSYYPSSISPTLGLSHLAQRLGKGDMHA